MKKCVLIAFYVLLANSVFCQFTNAVLAEGKYYKSDFVKSGVYKLTYNELSSQGILSAPVSSDYIAVFAGLGGMLPELNSASDPMDLQEIALDIHDGGDGIFGQGDYILFYLEAASKWKRNGNQYVYETNAYSDIATCFISFEYMGGIRKRIVNSPQNNNLHDTIINSFPEKIHIEKELYNLFKSSREWVGERLDDVSNTLNIQIQTPGIITSSQARIAQRFISTEIAKLTFTCNGQTKMVSNTYKPSANKYISIEKDTVWNLSSEISTMTILFTRLSSFQSNVYLDYINVFYQRNLRFNNTQLNFNTLGLNASHNNAKYIISNATQNVKVWDISDALTPTGVQGTFASSELSFVSSTDEVKEYVVFSDETAYSFSPFVEIANQNLHALELIDYVIIAHENFWDEANLLAEWHRERGLNVFVVKPQTIYNEFSYGRQDPMGIRTFLRYLRNKAIATNTLEHKLKYCCLFGGASYDYRNKVATFKNFVPNYQYPTCLQENLNLSTDDMYAYLDNGETGHGTSSDKQDIAIGRLPATTKENAQVLIDKIFRYGSHDRLSSDGAASTSNFGEWRNVVTNFADDGVTEGFVNVYEGRPYFEAYFNANLKQINLEKIYIDAYRQEATASGARYPEAKTALKQRIERGTLIWNYEGHSSPILLTDEAVIETSDLISYENKNKLTVLFAASCSFSKYDDPELTSGGELAILSPKGCAIASVATSRIAYTSPNDLFHGNWNHRMLERIDGRIPTLGEAFMLARNDCGNPRTLKPFVLLGDPALPVALPRYKVNTTSVNDMPISGDIDTVRALATVNIKGNISDFDDNELDHFNGFINVTVFDKPTLMHTRGNRNSVGNGNNPIYNYYVQKNIIYKGTVAVANGQFNVDFTVPKDIQYNFGNGKVSYYAYCDTADASGYFTDIVVGGFSDNFSDSADAPIVKLFMNDTNFISGNITNPDPVLLAVVSDNYGINFSGSGIGHDIVMILDEDSKNPKILNEFFEYIDYQGNLKIGNLNYYLTNLPAGKHNLSLKVWNLFNISSTSTIDFVVENQTGLLLDKAYNFPNPVEDHTYFYFTHNSPKQIKSIEIRIFDYMGRSIIRLVRKVEYLNSFATIPLYWDAKNAGGNRLSAGVYPYCIIVTCENGESQQISAKLVIK